MNCMIYSFLLGIPPNLPQGAVPPGARFDPFGPPLPDRTPFTPTRRPDFGTPRPSPSTGGYGDPDPNHLPMPGPQGPYN